MPHQYERWLEPYAQKLRDNSTPGEIRLWSKVLRARGFHGYQFNRQFPMGRYIVDFVCRKLKLVVEVDGSSHQFKQEEDKIRDEYLQSVGYRVLRVAESAVMHDLDNVIRALETYLLPDNQEKPDFPQS